MHTGAATVESSSRYLKKLKMDLPFNSAIPVNIFPEVELKTLIQKNMSTSMFIAVLFIVTKIWKQPKCPSADECIKQLWAIYIMEYHLAIKKNKVLPFATVWMDLGKFMLSKISQSEKDKYHMVSLICGI